MCLILVFRHFGDTFFWDTNIFVWLNSCFTSPIPSSSRRRNSKLAIFTKHHVKKPLWTDFSVFVHVLNTCCYPQKSFHCRSSLPSSLTNSWQCWAPCGCLEATLALVNAQYENDLLCGARARPHMIKIRRGVYPYPVWRIRPLNKDSPLQTILNYSRQTISLCLAMERR